MPPADRRNLRADAGDPVSVLAAGQVGFATAAGWQRRLGARRAAGELGDTLLLVEHPPVYTIGRRGETSEVLWDAGERARRGIELAHADRGGQVTYHGPGQLVGYPILQLVDRRVGDYMRAIEEVNLRLAGSFGLDAHRLGTAPGVWVGGRKLTAVGARVLARRITRHGWATNVTTDLSAFEGIVACGDPQAGACSLRSAGAQADMDTAIRRTIGLFGEVFGCSLTEVGSEELGLTATVGHGPGGPPVRRPTSRWLHDEDHKP